jgi:hypothetical protein
MIDFLFSILYIYLIVGVAVGIYAKIVAKTNLAAMFVVMLFWPIFLITGYQSGALSGRSQKKLR